MMNSNQHYHHVFIFYQLLQCLFNCLASGACDCSFSGELLRFFKGVLCSWGEEIQSQTCLFFHNWINKLFSEENKVSRTLLGLERWQGPPRINKVKQYEIVLSPGWSVKQSNFWLKLLPQNDIIYILSNLQWYQNQDKLQILIIFFSVFVCVCVPAWITSVA